MLCSSSVWIGLPAPGACPVEGRVTCSCRNHVTHSLHRRRERSLYGVFGVWHLTCVKPDPQILQVLSFTSLRIWMTIFIAHYAPPHPEAPAMPDSMDLRLKPIYLPMSSPVTSIRVQLPDGSQKELPAGSTPLD